MVNQKLIEKFWVTVVFICETWQVKKIKISGVKKCLKNNFKARYQSDEYTWFFSCYLFTKTALSHSNNIPCKQLVFTKYVKLPGKNINIIIDEIIVNSILGKNQWNIFIYQIPLQPVNFLKMLFSINYLELSVVWLLLARTFCQFCGI